MIGGAAILLVFNRKSGDFSISPGEIIGFLEWGRVFLEGALSKWIYVSLSQWLIFGVFS